MTFSLEHKPFKSSARICIISSTVVRALGNLARDTSK